VCNYKLKKYETASSTKNAQNEKLYGTKISCILTPFNLDTLTTREFVG
jgi:hypothetical protein